MKRKLLMTCYLINLIMIPVSIFYPLITFYLRKIAVFSYISDEFFMNIRIILTLPIFVLWIYSMIIWSKKDKVIHRFFLLFFLNGLYTPFYFSRILKNDWLD